MKVIYMGTGTSVGMPMIGHDNAGIDLSDKRNWRTRTSVHVEMAGLSIQVDATPEFRVQCLAQTIMNVDMILLTHEHSDHVMGLDDMRRFCAMSESGRLPIYSHQSGLQRVREVYPYAMYSAKWKRGYAAFDLHEMPSVLELEGGRVYSTLLPHGSFQTLGFVFEEDATGARFAYYTDCCEITEEAFKLAQGAQAVTLDGLRYEPHPTHMTIEKASSVATSIGAPVTYLTHIAWPVNHADCERDHLPENVRLAYDGLVLEL